MWKRFLREASWRYGIGWGWSGRVADLNRDQEDYPVVKIFVYRSDADEGAGPLSYARSTHPKGSSPAARTLGGG